MFLATPLPASVSRLSDGCLLAVNDAWLAMVGRTRESVIGRTSVELGLWPTQAHRQAFVDQAGTASEAEQRHLLHLAHGAEHSVRLHAVRIEAVPEPLLLVFAIEIAQELDAKRARLLSEAALREANHALERRLELHAAMEKLARVGHWTNTADDLWVRWSPGLYEIAGLSPNEPLLRTHVRSYVHPEDLPIWLEARAACLEREIDFRWLHPDGRVRWFRTRMGRTAVANSPQTDFGVVQDITTEREAREGLAEQLSLLQNIAARVPGLMYRAQLRPDGRSVISYVNDRAREMLEVEPAELQSDARTLFRRVHPDDMAQVQRSLDHSARTLSIWRQTYRACLSGGRTRWYSVEAVPQAEPDGSVVWHGFTTDVTEERIAQQRLERQHRMLEAVREAQAVYIEADDKRRAFEGLLAAFLRLTNSDYGFVGEVHYNEDDTPYLRTHAITNIAWDEASRLFYESQMDAGMAFRNLRSLFGQAMVTGQPVIANDPLQGPRSGGRPAGHPPMDAFLGIPLSVGDRVVAMVGLANKPGGYGPEDLEFLQPLLGTVRQLVLAWRGHAERRRTLVELERTSQELVEKGETLQATLDSISQGLTKVDASGRILIYNQRVVELLDLPESLLSKKPTQLEVLQYQCERGDFGEDLGLVEPEVRSYLLQPANSATPESYWRKTRSGRTLDIRTLHLPDGGLVRTFSDVTSYIEVQEALREERQRLAWVLEATRPGIWETNLDSGELRIDDRWAEMLGYSVPDLEPISLTTWVDFVHPDDLPQAQSALMEHWTGQTPFVDIDIRLRHRLGHWVWVNKRGRVHERDTQGRGRYMSGTHLEITDRIAAQEEVLALNATLEQRVSERTAALERSLRDMEAISYSIAHDLRAPLRSVNGFSALIAEETDAPLSPVASDMFARINNSSRKMGQMLTDMLELLRVVRVDLDAVPVDLESLAKAVASELAHEAPQAEISIGPLPTVLGDATLLRQMLHNLMENALKYSQHRAHPRLSLHFDEGLGAFCLRDNGMGFDMAHAGKLFGLFQRLHVGSDVPGTGVGLAIVTRIIERHGGRIWAKAQPDVGASFWWTLTRS
jgi:PAS domain S-box-containing protein